MALTESLKHELEQAIRHELDRVREEVIKQAVESFELKLREMTARAAVRVFDLVKFDLVEKHLVITVEHKR